MCCSLRKQFTFQRALETAVGVQLSEPSIAQWHSDTEQHGRAVGSASLHHAHAVRLPRRVQRVVLQGHREPRREQNQHR